MTTDIPTPRTPGMKLLIALLLGALLAVPLFAVYLLVWDRQTQSTTASESITQGWGGPQHLAGPLLVIPFQADSAETVTENGRATQRSVTVSRELVIAPDLLDARAAVAPQQRKRSIYEAVVYTADAAGQVRFSMPADLARLGVPGDRLRLDQAELRFGLSDPRGIAGTPPQVTIGGRALPLQPGHGLSSTGGDGFHAPLDASALRAGPLAATFRFTFRGNGSIALAPDAGDTRWRMTSSWPSPSFSGGFLPVAPTVGPKGFAAEWRVGNLALGRELATVGDAKTATGVGETAVNREAWVELITPVDVYSEVNRSVKYGFLFIGFTAAYLLASAAIIGLIAAYSAAVLGSWRRGGLVAGLLAALYAVLYVLLSLEAFSLIIGSVLLFCALAGIMYVTRRLDWSGSRRS